MRQKGFTLIELMVVIAIIGILAAVAIPNFMAARDRAHIAAAEVTIGAIRQALELYLVDYISYPSAMNVTNLVELGGFLYNPQAISNFHNTILGYNDTGIDINGDVGDRSGDKAYDCVWDGGDYSFWALARDRPPRVPIRATTMDIVFIPDGRTTWQIVR